MIELNVNGEMKTLPASLPVEQALAHWGYQGKDIAVAINGDFVPRSRYAEQAVNAQDHIDIVAPIQGG